MQATVRGFDPATRSGTVFLDDGTVAGFGPIAFAGSGLRLLRPGQRVVIGCDPGGAIVSLTLATFPLPGATGRVSPLSGHREPGRPVALVSRDVVGMPKCQRYVIEAFHQPPAGVVVDL
jgi:hypothetical protein